MKIHRLQAALTLAGVLLGARVAAADPLTFTVAAAAGKSQMTWDGRAHGETVHGVTAQVSGTLSGNPKDLQDQPHIQLQADLASMNTGNNSRDSTMRGSGCLDTAHFPTVTWVLKSVSKTSSRELADGQAVQVQAVGDLTLHGVTKEIPVQATVVFQNNTLHVTGTLDINMTDFDIRPPSFLFFKMENTIHINLDVTGTR